jgi:hypothetical protein
MDGIDGSRLSAYDAAEIQYGASKSLEKANTDKSEEFFAALAPQALLWCWNCKDDTAWSYVGAWSAASDGEEWVQGRCSNCGTDAPWLQMTFDDHRI